MFMYLYAEICMQEQKLEQESELKTENTNPSSLPLPFSFLKGFFQLQQERINYSLLWSWHETLQRQCFASNYKHDLQLAEQLTYIKYCHQSAEFKKKKKRILVRYDSREEEGEDFSFTG